MTSAAVAIEIVAALSKKTRQARGVLPGCAGGAPPPTGGGGGGSGSGAEAVERSGKAALRNRSARSSGRSSVKSSLRPAGTSSPRVSGKSGTSPAASGNDGVRMRGPSRELNSDWMPPSSQKKKPAVQALVPGRGLTIKNTLAGAWK